ncbi:unnamed protein product [Notodromas monacha]|uniref:LIM interaction domain-containing protein n=1 Tax=Notodromas monacha TaxID=399045 RepID=A0A7R9BMF7_9CRUS|nr:unnamed protein product [Notodromas monacha]CAG0916702.1 unnamed protein product [Notodromas monacha]
MEGRLILEFTFDDLMRIKSWHMSIRTHREFIPRSVVAMHVANAQQQQQPISPDAAELSKNITRQGLTSYTLNYLRLCVILEPMQELMSRHKAYSLSPRDCLKTTLFQKWQRMVAPPGKWLMSPSLSRCPVKKKTDEVVEQKYSSVGSAHAQVMSVMHESQRPASKRRKRKGSASNSAASASGGPGGGGGGGGNKKKSPGSQNFSLASQDVMVVGEPSLMGGEFGDEDERLITRLENAQFEAANGLEDPGHFDGGMLTSAPSPWQQQGAPGSVGPPPGGGGGGPGPGPGGMTPTGGPPQQQQQQPPQGQNPDVPDKKSPVVSQ